MHRSSPNSVGKGSDHLQPIKFWPSRPPGRGSAAGDNFCSAIQLARSVCNSSERFFHCQLDPADLLCRSVIVSGVKTVTGMAVDWISKNLYWVDREKVEIVNC